MFITLVLDSVAAGLVRVRVQQRGHAPVVVFECLTRIQATGVSVRKQYGRANKDKRTRKLKYIEHVFSPLFGNYRYVYENEK